MQSQYLYLPLELAYCELSNGSQFGDFQDPQKMDKMRVKRSKLCMR